MAGEHAAEAAHDTGRAAHDLGSEAVDALEEYILPLIGGVAGLVVGPSLLGGAGLIYSMGVSASGGKLSNNDTWAIASQLLAGGLWGAIALMVWPLRNKAGRYGGLIISPIATFFAGTAVRFIIGGLTGGTYSPGVLDKVAASATHMVAGKGGK